MKIRLLFIAILSCLPLAASLADQTDDVKAQINKIKKSSQYIYAESTAPTETDARHYAEEKLYEEVNAWVATQKKMKKRQFSLMQGRYCRKNNYNDSVI